MRGYVSEGCDHLREALESAPSDTPHLRAQSLLGFAVLASEQRDYSLSAEYVKESLSLFQTVDDSAWDAASLLQLGHLSLLGADLTEARTHLTGAIDYCRRAGWIYSSGIKWMLMALADHEVDDEHSAQCMEDARRMLQRAEDSRTP